MGARDRLKGGFVTGLVVIAPLLVTAFVLKLGADWLVGIVDPLVTWTGLSQYTANDELIARIVAVIGVVGGITILGYGAQWSAGRRLFGGVGRVLAVIPLVSTIYTNVRRVANALADSDSRYDRTVLVEYPRTGVYSIGLITGESPAEVTEVTGDATYNVYMPNSPNPTGGRLVLVPEEQIHEVDLSVRRGVRTIVTTGVGDDAEPIPLDDLPQTV